MTALPLRDFTAAEQDKLKAIEAAPAAEEAIRERVARAMFDAETPDATWTFHAARCYRLADAALAVLRGPSSDAEQAVERVLELCSDWEDYFAANRTVPYAHSMRGAAERVRAAVAGD